MTPAAADAVTFAAAHLPQHTNHHLVFWGWVRNSNDGPVNVSVAPIAPEGEDCEILVLATTVTLNPGQGVWVGIEPTGDGGGLISYVDDPDQIRGPDGHNIQALTACLPTGFGVILDVTSFPRDGPETSQRTIRQPFYLRPFDAPITP